jgi:hypothetical protein
VLAFAGSRRGLHTDTKGASALELLETFAKRNLRYRVSRRGSSEAGYVKRPLSEWPKFKNGISLGKINLPSREGHELYGACLDYLKSDQAYTAQRISQIEDRIKSLQDVLGQPKDRILNEDEDEEFPPGTRPFVGHSARN